MNLLPVIMAGGTGSRLWPLSRELYPKQFLPLAGDRTMVQETVGRLDGLDTLSPIVICNEEHRFIVAEQLRGIGSGRPKIVLEPAGRNTAPAIALAALQARDQGEDPFLLVLAADHIIANVTAFHESVASAVKLAETGKLVTFGVVARTPETGYGYIQRGAPMKDGYAVTAFVEKPDRKTAESYISSGDYYWNSGMFVFKASRYVEELTKFRPAIVAACEAALGGAETDLDFLRLDAEAFERCPSESVDYAVMQNTSEAAVVPLDAGWNDIGSWSSLWEVSDQDGDGNALRGDVIASDTRNTLAFGDSRLVALVGVEDLIVVETKDAVLVAHKDKIQNVKAIVNEIARLGRHEHIHHRTVYRPWGHYDSIDFGQRDQVKRITVSPGAKLSVQKHFHRSEHWVVVRGTALVHKGDEILTLSENESTYIPVGEIHALENPGKIPLELIEVQTGSYLGEDDIVRLDDRYGRR